MLLATHSRTRAGRPALALATVVVLLAGLVALFPRATTVAAIQLEDAVVELAAAPAVTDAATIDLLPTVQIDGVVWGQVVNGTTVYAAGQFQNARPAGSAPGTDLTPRRNLLAFDITTGKLITSFVPDLNAQARAVAVSPDGRRLYVGGDFTLANGLRHYRLAAYDTATGALIDSFAPTVDNPVKALVATDTTVYLGGSFTSVNGVARSGLAAVDATTGALTGWNPSADGAVHAMVLAPGGSRLVVGGMFLTIGGTAAYGMASLDAVTGALQPWAANTVIRNGGLNGAISSLTTDGTSVFGTGYARGSGSNFEGTFAADPTTGSILWMEDCHGDSYGNFARGGAVYVVGHPHDCGTLGGFPQKVEWWRALAFVNAPTRTLSRTLQPNYTSFTGRPGTSLLPFFPSLVAGTYTGQGQAAWTITGNRDYLVMGGEFPTVNNVAQQGLARFGTRAVVSAPQHGPEAAGALNNPVLTSLSAGTVRVAFRSNWDRDNQSLNYRVVRDGSVEVYNKAVDSFFWDRPYQSFTDSGLAPGSTHTYRVYITDGVRTASSQTVSTTVSTTDTTSPYVTKVRADGASLFWRLGESSGTTAWDWAGGTDGTVGSGATRGVAGAVAGSTGTTMNGTADGLVVSPYAGYAPQTFSVQSWVRTTSTRGGEIMGFGNASTGSSTSNDRVLYMDNAGRIYFGVTTATGGVAAVGSSAVFNNGQWHQVTGTLSAGGMRLYVDGVQVAGRADTTTAMTQYGWWRAGGDTLTGYPGTRSSQWFTGSLDEVAVYPVELTAAQVAAQYAARQGAAPVNQTPTAAFTATTSDLTATVDAATSADPDGSISGYAWNFGDGSTGSGVTANRTYAAAGSYPVTLTVTDDAGATATTTRTVTVTAPPVVTGPLVADTFTRTVTGGFGTAETGGAWTTTSASSTSVADGRARIALAAGAGVTAALPTVPTADVDLVADIALDKRVTGGSAYVSLQARKVTAGGYRAKTVIAANGAVSVSLVKLTGSTETTLATVAGPTWVVGSTLRVHFQVVGTTLRATVFDAAGAEPATWSVTATDGTYTAAGAVGLYGYLSSGATNAPVTVLLDTLTVTRP